MALAMQHSYGGGGGLRGIPGHDTTLLLAAIVLTVPIVTFLLGAPVAVLCGFTMAVLVTARFMIAVPTVLVTLFFFQNTLISLLSPAVSSLDEFDMVRAMNFVVLCGCYGIVILATWNTYQRADHRLQKWVLLVVATASVVFLYFLLGLASGNARDVLVYLRNILTPLACLHIGIIVGAAYRPDLRPTLMVILLLSIIFGYLEFAFGLDWLRIVNGDDYVRLKLKDEIASGAFVTLLEQTGTVVRGLEDQISRPFLNITGTFGDTWHIVRIGGPNFHSISFAYGLAVTSLYLAMKKTWWPLIVALPLLVLIGSKGALILVSFALIGSVAARIFSPGLVLSCFLFGLAGYVAATYLFGLRVGDYHVLGLRSGLREFFLHPLGAGLGQSGISSTATGTLDWNRFQHQGIADVPVESSIGVLLHQMGIGAFVFIAMIFGVAKAGWRQFVSSGEPARIIFMIVPAMLIANAIFQEEAFFAPMALGTALLLFGIEIGSAELRRNK